MATGAVILRREAVMITLDEVLAHGMRWFECAMHGGSPAEQVAFFLHPHARIYVVNTGVTIDFDEHYKLHKQWVNERHLLGDFKLTRLSDAPERVRVTGSVYWEAQDAKRPPPNVIKAVVGEDWIVERVPSGELKFVLYMNLFHHLLPDSAPLQLE
jgi:hypothetical protein